MDNTFTSTDWTLIQSFVAVAENGSFSGAGRALGRSQPTLGRQIQALEASLGVSLFDRHARGLSLSETGSSLLPLAQQMRDAMQSLTLTAAGQSKDLSGTVRLTASVFMSHHLLPDILASIRKTEPQIQLELVPTDATENLLYREADIAIRMYRPKQLDIVAQRVGAIQLGAYAAHSYLARKGCPTKPDDLFDHDIVGYDSNDLIIETMRLMGYTVKRSQFPVRCDNQSAYWQLVRAGCGIGFCQASVADADPLVEKLEFDLNIPPLEVWLAAPQAMHQTPRIRRVWDLLVGELTAVQDGRSPV
jgi:DNA-binding transcriptional LysR family regulator